MIGKSMIALGVLIGIGFGIWYYITFSDVYSYRLYIAHAVTDYWYMYIIIFGLSIIGVVIMDKER